MFSDWERDIKNCNDGEGCNDVSRSLCKHFPPIQRKCRHKCKKCECKDLKKSCKTVKRKKMCKGHPLSKVFEHDCAKTCRICGQRADESKSTTEMTTTPTTATTKEDIK